MSRSTARRFIRGEGAGWSPRWRGNYREIRRITIRSRCLPSNETYPMKPGHWEIAMEIKSHTAAPAAALALGLFFTPPVFIAIDAIIDMVAPPVPAAIGNLGFMSPARAQPGALTKKQSDAL